MNRRSRAVSMHLQDAYTWLQHACLEVGARQRETAMHRCAHRHQQHHRDCIRLAATSRVRRGIHKGFVNRREGRWQAIAAARACTVCLTLASHTSSASHLTPDCSAVGIGSSRHAPQLLLCRWCSCGSSVLAFAVTSYAYIPRAGHLCASIVAAALLFTMRGAMCTVSSFLGASRTAKGSHTCSMSRRGFAAGVFPPALLP